MEQDSETVLEPSNPDEAEQSATVTKKQCKWCVQEIAWNARKCPHCGSFQGRLSHIALWAPTLGQLATALAILGSVFALKSQISSTFFQGSEVIVTDGQMSADSGLKHFSLSLSVHNVGSVAAVIHSNASCSFEEKSTEKTVQVLFSNPKGTVVVPPGTTELFSSVALEEEQYGVNGVGNAPEIDASFFIKSVATHCEVSISDAHSEMKTTSFKVLDFVGGLEASSFEDDQF